MQLSTEVEITSHRHVIGRFIVAYKKLIRLLIAPYLRNVFERDHQMLSETEKRIDDRLRLIDDRLQLIEQHLPTIHNYISSFANTSRQIKRDLESLSGNKAILPHSKEMEITILNREKLKSMADNLRINIGCGHIPVEGYLNIDKRGIPNVDIVAEAYNLPFENKSISEIYSSHLIEHFPMEEFRRVILPYWYNLLKFGGLFRAILPDWETMIKQYVKGDYPFENLRLVTFGAQDYNGNFHYNMFSMESLKEMLEDAGFKDIIFPVRGRVNGACYEMEVRAVK